jgi:hypothetical protein
MKKITVLTNVYNEEYLLPFWLEHHKNIFDHGIVFDWGCTDRSMDLVREICPTWEIRKAIEAHPSRRLEKFDAFENDVMFMYTEMELSEYKLVLNTTEFLISPGPIRDYIQDTHDMAYPIQSLVALSTKEVQEPKTLKEFFGGVERVEKHLRKWRTLHSHFHGQYSLGRHEITLNPWHTTPAYILWCAEYPWNDKVLARGLQITDKIPEYDYEKQVSYHHRFNAEERNKNRNQHIADSVPISELPGLEASLM